MSIPLQWRHNGCDGVSNHQPHDCLLNCLFRRRSKKISTLLVTGLCAGNSPVTGEFRAQRAGNAENVSIWWRHHACSRLLLPCWAPLPMLPAHPTFLWIFTMNWDWAKKRLRIPSSPLGNITSEQFNPFVPGRCGIKFKSTIFKLFYGIVSKALVVELLSGGCHRSSLEMSTLVQVMAWCRQATSIYLNQCWPRSMSPHCIAMSQWVSSSHFILYWWLDCCKLSLLVLLPGVGGY